MTILVLAKPVKKIKCFNLLGCNPAKPVARLHDRERSQAFHRHFAKVGCR
jgi:hypothetical protein